MRQRLGLVAFVSCVSVVLIGCPKPTPELSSDSGITVTVADTGAASDAMAATAEAGANSGAADESVEPVYAIEKDAPPIPLAEKICVALTTIPEKKRAACCKTKPSIVITDECTRQLSAAIRHNALSVDEKDVTACIAAYDKAFEGCDWVGPFAPGAPAACQGIFKGKIGSGQKCRSSLECTGDQRCHDLGPTSPGKCGPAGTGDQTCGGTVDSLAAYTLQSDVDKRHPECKDRCIKHKCQPPVSENGACLITSDCLDGLQCIATGEHSARPGSQPKRCVAGKAPGKDGEACPGGVCEAPLQCIRGKCAARKATGEACTDDFECKGGCLRPDAGVKGTCGPRCDIR